MLMFSLAEYYFNLLYIPKYNPVYSHTKMPVNPIIFVMSGNICSVKMAVAKVQTNI